MNGRLNLVCVVGNFDDFNVIRELLEYFWKGSALGVGGSHRIFSALFLNFELNTWNTVEV